MDRAVVIALRVANKEDFAYPNGAKKTGVLYFEQSVNGSVSKQPFYFTEQTDLEVFRQLYTHSQIYVPTGIFDIADSNQKPNL